MSQTGEIEVDSTSPEPSRQGAGLRARVAGSAPASVMIAAILPILAIVGAACWWFLYEWYGVFEHRDQPHFAFQKLPGGFDHPTLRWTLVVFLALSLIYVAVLRILWKSRRMTPLKGVSLGVLVAGMAVGSVLLYPVSALDVFNYMIELKLAYHYDENPYLVTFEQYTDDPYARPAFLTNVTLFYGPAWLIVSWIPVAVAGFADVIQTLLAMKVFNVVLLAITALLIARTRQANRMQWFAAAIFVANPLVMFEGVANAHNDVLLTLFLVGAMLALKRKSPLAGPLLALSALVKLYSGVLLPLFIVVALKERWGWKRIGTTVALTVVTVAIICAPWWSEGRLVDGLTAGLEESQGMDHVSPYSLAQQHAQQQYAEGRFDQAFIVSRPAQEVVPQETREQLTNRFAAVLVVATLGLAVSAWKGREPVIVAAETLLVLLLTTTNLYAWYLIPVFALLAMRPDKKGLAYIIGATVLGLVYHPMFVYAHFNSGWSRFEVHQFLALFLTVPILLYLAARALGGVWTVVRQRHARTAAA